VEAITTLHKTKPPQIHQRGQLAIDGIFLSESLLEGAKGVYFEFDDRLGSNHRGIWLDLPVVDLFGDPKINYTLAKGRRLQCKDPRIIIEYTEELEELIKNKPRYSINKLKGISPLTRNVNTRPLARQ